MKKTTFYIICILFISTISSCRLLGMIIDIATFADTIDTRDKDNDVIGNVQIYIENKTDEIIVVFSKVRSAIYDNKKDMEIELARIPEGKAQKINIRKETRIIIIGGQTQIKYKEIVCDIDQETIIVY